MNNIVADKENPECVYQLALIYLSGIQGSLEPDLNYAKSLVLEAVEFEYPPALTAMAEFYGRGELGFDVDMVMLFNSGKVHFVPRKGGLTW